MSLDKKEIYEFGDFRLDVDERTIERIDGGQLRTLPTKTFDALVLLVRKRGHLVTRDEFLQHVWPDTIVEENNLEKRVHRLRQFLCETDGSSKHIETVRGHGYRFVAPVHKLEVSDAWLPVTHCEGGPAGDTAAARGAAPQDAASQNGVGTAGVRRLRGVIAAVGAALIMAVAWWGAAELGFDVPFADRGGSPAPADSIAVLPLLDMSPGRDSEYFADGLSEELLNALTQIPGLRVIARTSSFFFKGRNADIPTVGKRLNVSHVLEGSVRRSGDKVRITVQLVDVHTNAHLWSKTYDRELRDIFAIQKEVAVAVASALQLTLSQRGAGAIAPPIDPRAHEEFLQARFFWHRRGPDDVKRAAEHYQRAVTIDPDFARAWVGLAGVYFLSRLTGMKTGGSPANWEWLKEYHRMLERALEIDPYQAEAYVRISYYYDLTGNQAKSEEHWAKAQALDPDSPLVLTVGATEAIMRGQYDEALSLYRRALELDPLSALTHGNFGRYLLAAGLLEEALKETRAALELSPQFSWSVDRDLVLIEILQGRYGATLAMIEKQQPGAQQDALLTLAYSGLGRQDEAAAAFKRLQAKDDLEAAFRQAEVHAFRGESDRALQLLESIVDRLNSDSFWGSSLTPERGYIVEARLSPLFIPLRGDPRWQALFKKWKKWL
jgi:TolB-like protein/DNA-binding winged helix-turn-helix (wHTH) protein/tetratricopeptide (TPR) repeat protein